MKSSKCHYTVKDMLIRLRGATQSENNSHLSVFSTNKKLQKAKFIDRMFEILSDKCSLYDYESLRIFVEVSECEEAKGLMTDFTGLVKDSLLKELNLLSEHVDFKASQLPFDKNRKLEIKCENKDLHITTEDEKLIRIMLCELFKLPYLSVLLVDITQGCIALIYEISQEVKEHLLQYNITWQVIDVQKFVITKLIIDDEWELQMSPNMVCLVYYDTE